MDFPGRVITMFIALVLIILFPLQYLMQSTVVDTASFIDNETQKLTNSIREKGYLDIAMYEDFIKELDTTRELYDFEIEDVNPIAGTASSKEAFLDQTIRLSEKAETMELKILQDDFFRLPSFTGHTHIEACYAGHKEDALFPVDLRSVNSNKMLTSITVTPQEQIIFKQESPTFTVSAIYADGTREEIPPIKYTVSSIDISSPGERTATISYTEGSITKTELAKIYVDELNSILVSPSELFIERYTEASALPISVFANYNYSSSENVNGKFVIDGYAPENIGAQEVTVSYSRHGTTAIFKIIVNVTALEKVCPRCSNSYLMNEDDTDPGCPICNSTLLSISVIPDYIELIKGQDLMVTVQGSYADGSIRSVSGWSSDYNPQTIGPQKVKVEYGHYRDEVSVFVQEPIIVCPICHSEYLVSETKCPVCSETVVSISTTPGAITVKRYDIINLIVNATYADGSSRQVTDWSIDMTTTEAGVFMATVSYENVSTTISLTVLPEATIICQLCGFVYDKGQYPNGCPICSKKLTGIEAYLTSGSKLVQYGTIPSIAIVEIYQDTHREITFEGYSIEGYKPYTMGEQIITIKYAVFKATLSIEVVNILSSVTCSNDHVYYRNEDGSDPGCPYCEIVKEQEDRVYFFDITYTPEILETLYQEKIYYFEERHYITIAVTKRQKSLLVMVQQKFFKTAMFGRKKRYVYGGRVFK